MARNEAAGAGYGWGGRKMSIFNLDDPEYCEYGCPVCTRAKKGFAWAVAAQKAEMALTLGGWSLRVGHAVANKG